MKYIVNLDETRNFSESARLCGVTQPTLSMQIKKAEDLLNMVIFDRDKNPIIPTIKGEEIIRQCRRVLKESSFFENLNNDLNEVQGEFHLGIIPTIAPYLIPLFIKNFEKKYPKLKLFIKERQTHEIIKELKNEKLDFGILATPLNDDQLYEQVLYYEPFSFFLNDKHSFLSMKSINLNGLNKETIYHLEDGHCLRFQSEQICGRVSGKINQSISLVGGQLETLVNLTKKFGGMTLVPELFVNYLSKADKNLVRPIEGKKPSREVSLVTSRYFAKEAIGQILETEILHSLPSNIYSLKKNEVKIIPIA